MKPKLINILICTWNGEPPGEPLFILMRIWEGEPPGEPLLINLGDKAGYDVKINKHINNAARLEVRPPNFLFAIRARVSYSNPRNTGAFFPYGRSLNGLGANLDRVRRADREHPPAFALRGSIDRDHDHVPALLERQPHGISRNRDRGGRSLSALLAV